MAFVDAQNLEIGFLTRHCINKLTKEQIMGFSMETEKIINQLSHQLEQVADGNIPTDYECGTLFQYVFDKVTEALYKLLMGKVMNQFDEVGIGKHCKKCKRREFCPDPIVS